MKESLPDIYYFNPTCEYAVANGHSSWQPNLLLQKMEEDLGILPLYFAAPKDVVLVKKIPAPGFIDLLSKASVQVPRFFDIHQITRETSFLRIPRNWLLPWGWSPAAHRLLEPLKASCSEGFKSSPVAVWRNAYREIYSKKFALEILRQVLPLLPPEQVLQPHQVPQICTARHEVEELLNRWGRLMVKAPWSSSGRGLQRITKTPIAPKVWEKLLGIVHEQGYAVVEPYQEKVMDMALQFKIINGSVRYIGISRFFTDAKGQYQGNYLNGWPDTTGRQEIDFAEEMLKVLVPQLIHVLEKSILVHYYEGNFGVDTLIFRDQQGDLRINPCLEINVRQSMGLLSLHLERLLAPDRKGIFKIFFQKGKSFDSFSEPKMADMPLTFNNNRIHSGFMPLTPSDASTLFGAYIVAGSQETV